MRIKIVSDGIITKVVNAETGERIENVVEFNLSVSQIGGEPTKATFTVIAPELDMTVDAYMRRQGKIEV